MLADSSFLATIRTIVRARSLVFESVGSFWCLLNCSSAPRSDSRQRNCRSRRGTRTSNLHRPRSRKRLTFHPFQTRLLFSSQSFPNLLGLRDHCRLRLPRWLRIDAISIFRRASASGPSGLNCIRFLSNSDEILLLSVRINFFTRFQSHSGRRAS